MAECVLRLVGIGQGYRRGREWWQVFSDVSLTVGAGEFVGLLGAAHEGKTTLLEAAAGLTVPEDGEVWFEGRDLAKCSEDDRTELLGERIAWMPREDFADFGVLEYVALPLAMGRGSMDGAEDRARAALDRVGAKDCLGRSYGATQISNRQSKGGIYAQVGAQFQASSKLLNSDRTGVPGVYVCYEYRQRGRGYGWRT